MYDTKFPIIDDIIYPVMAAWDYWKINVTDSTNFEEWLKLTYGIVYWVIEDKNTGQVLAGADGTAEDIAFFKLKYS